MNRRDSLEKALFLRKANLATKKKQRKLLLLLSQYILLTNKVELLPIVRARATLPFLTTWARYQSDL